MSHPYVHLRVQSDFSFGRASSKVVDLVERAKALGQPALALTDEHNLHGAMTLADKASYAKIQAIVGIKLYVPSSVKGKSGSILLLAQNQVGYVNLCRLHNLAVTPGRSSGLIDGALLDKIYKDNLSEGVLAITGCGSDGLVGRLLREGPEAASNESAKGALEYLAQFFPGRIYVEICRNGAPTAEEAEIERRTLDIALRLDLPIVGTTEALYATEDRHDACRIAQAVMRKGTVITDDAGHVENEAPRRYHMRSTEEMAEMFADLPEAFAQTAAIAQRCGFAPAKRKEFLPPFKTEGGRTETEEMTIQATAGLEMRLNAHAIAESDRQQYRERLTFELGIIDGMGFPGYFLIVSDFIKWAKSQNIPVGPGRGSGAGSVVAWSLEITDLDPIRFGLLFERFLNPERVSMPDFDVDFCTKRRGEVINYVAHRYGAECVAGIATFTLARAKMAFKDAARVIQHNEEGSLSQFEVNGLTELIIDKPADPKTLTQAFDEIDEFRKRILGSKRAQAAYTGARKIEGLYRTSSAHAAGIVIADRPLTDFVPVGFDDETGQQVAQFNMKEVEKAGLVKFDFLALKNLTVIQEALDHIKVTKGLDINLSTLPLDDADVYAMLAQGRTNGVFQFESSGMKNVLVEMRASRFEDLIAAVSLYRPGPMDQIPKYCRCKVGEEEPEYPEPIERTKPFLEETFGIMVYQEQVMRVAQEVAGYSLGQADMLRRAMGKKIPEEMAKEKGRFIEGAVQRGTQDKKAAELFDLIEKFAGYGFNKSHAAAYALIAYHTAWLKRRHPVEYYSALLSYESKAERKTVIKSDMDTDGIEFLSPDMNKSGPNFAPEQKADGAWAIRFGLTAVTGVSEVGGFLAERVENGPYASLAEFSERAGRFFNANQTTMLVKAGAFDSFSKDRNRKRASDTLTFLGKTTRSDKNTPDLFGGVTAIPLPRDIEDTSDWTDLIQREHEAVGFYFRQHPLDQYVEPMLKLKAKRRKSLIAYMADKNKGEVKGMVLFGMVEKPMVNLSKGKVPYACFDLLEASDSYRVFAFHNNRNETPAAGDFSGGKIPSAEAARNFLAGAKALNAPVVVIADLVLRDSEDAAVYAREIWLAENYISLVARKEKLIIEIDPRSGSLDPDDHIRLKELDAAARDKTTPFEQLRQEAVNILAPPAHESVQLAIEQIEALPESDGLTHEVMFTIVSRVGSERIALDFIPTETPKNRNINQRSQMGLLGLNGVTSVIAGT